MNATAEKISVVVVSFDGMEFIEDCLNSVVASTGESQIEIVVVDNGSKDGTVELIQNKFPSVRLIRNEINAGFAMAANQGVRAAAGEYILLLNQDTKIQSEANRKLAGYLAGKSKIGVIGPRLNGFDGALQKSCRSFPRYYDLFFEFTGLAYLFPQSRIFGHWKMGWFDHLSEREVDQPMGAAMMFRRELFNRLGGFDENFRIFFNDVDFCRRAKEAGHTNIYYPEAVIEHFVGGSTRTRKPQMILESHRAMFRYFRKNCGRSIAARMALYFWGALLYISAHLRAGFNSIFK